MSSLLRVEHVTISYNGKPVVQDVSFELKQGEILGIVGESGSGKSTIIKAIMGLLGEEGLVTRGDIWYKGENLTDMSEKKLRKLLGTEIGMVFQDCKAALCPVRTIGAQIYEAVSEHEKISKKVVRKRAGEIMKKIGLDDSERVLNSYPFELSGGQKKRVAIAGVLAMNPKILILDEPTAGLDPKGRDEILDQIAELHKVRGITIILVSHSMEDVAKYVERLIVMNHGEMVFDDTPKNVFSHYKELEGMGLAAPQITYIMHALSENGLNVDTTATTVEEARDTILEALKKQKPSLLKKGGRNK